MNIIIKIKLVVIFFITVSGSSISTTINEDSVIQYLHVLYCGNLTKEEAKQIHEDEMRYLKSMGSENEVIEKLFQFLENESIQNEWIERSKNLSYEYSYPLDNMATRALYAISDLSIDSVYMGRINLLVEKQFTTGTCFGHFAMAISAIYALGRDTTVLGIDRLKRMQQDIMSNKYSFVSYKDKLHFKPEEIKNSFLRCLFNNIHLQENRRKGLPWDSP